MAEARATDEQQQHLASDTDDDESAAATASFTYMTGSHLQLATDESEDDQPACDSGTQLCTKIFPTLPKLLQSGVERLQSGSTNVVQMLSNEFLSLFSLTTSAHTFMTNATQKNAQQDNWTSASRTPEASWLQPRPKHLRHGSIPTPRVKLEFFQNGGNHNLAFLVKTIPDMGSSRSIFGSNFVDKYNLKVNESPKAKALLLYNASNKKIGVRGVLDIQALYNGIMVHLNGLALQSELVAPLISWHDLTQLGICNLPEGVALFNFCAQEKSAKQCHEALHVPSPVHAPP